MESRFLKEHNRRNFKDSKQKTSIQIVILSICDL